MLSIKNELDKKSTKKKNHKRLNIVSIIQNNPENVLNDAIESRILTKVRKNFTKDEQDIWDHQ